MTRSRLIRLVVLLIAVLVAVKIVTTALAGWELYSASQALLDELAGAPVAPERLPDAVRRVSAGIGRAAAEIGPIAAAAGLAGGDGCAAAWLTAAAGAAAPLGEALAPLTETGLRLAETSSIQEIDVRDLRDRWDAERIDAALPAIRALMAQPPCPQLSPRAQRLYDAGRGGLFAAQVAAALPLPAMLADGSRWLILLNNSDELRATGGYTTALLALEVENGVLRWRLFNSYDVDDPELLYYHPQPPEPMRRYMALSRWLFRDANWSPDYPTAARQTIQLYQIDQRGAAVSGIITVNLTALETLTRFLPPVVINGETLTPENSLNRVRTAWNADAAQFNSDVAGRKDFLLESAAELASAIGAALDPLDAARLGLALEAMLARGDLLLYAADEGIQARFADLGWDGALDPFEGDTLMIVDTNLGYNKVSPSVERSARYRVDLTNPAAPTASLEITYHNTSETGVSCERVHRNWFGEAGEDSAQALPTITYEDRMTGCYWNYLRVVLTPGTTLDEFTAQALPAEWLIFNPTAQPPQVDAWMEAGFPVYGSMSILPAGERRTVTLTTRLPAAVLHQQADGAWLYRLLARRQPGSMPLVLQVEVIPPLGFIVASTLPDGIDGEPVTLTLDADRMLEARFTR
ncbi:MAG: DUF4012 domain-containing protein [Chloroflexi bacterium]|nr:DUF4012 domain-containing protein [Chloroflexota bacterium]